MRTLITSHGIYRYMIGSGFARIEYPDGRRQVVSLSRLTGRTHDTIERGRWKQSSDGMVTPRHVADWIRGHAD